jgi:hypothetical protein
VAVVAVAVVAVAVAVAVAVVAVAVAVGIRIAMTVGVAVAVRVAVLVVTVVVVARALVPFAVLVAKPLDAPRDLAASLCGVDLAGARLVQVRGNRAACVLTGRRLFAVLRVAFGQPFPGFHIAFIYATTARNTCIAHLRGGVLAPAFTGRRLRVLAVLCETRGMYFSSKLRAGGFADTWLGAREARLEHRGGPDRTVLFTGRRLGIAALICDAVRQRFPGDRSTSLCLTTVASGSAFT